MKPTAALLEAVRLHREGHQFKDIGPKLGVSTSHAHSLFWKGCRLLEADPDLQVQEKALSQYARAFLDRKTRVWVRRMRG